MYYKAKEVKGMKAAEVRIILAQYIIDVQPNAYGEVITEKLLTEIRTRSTDILQSMKLFLTSERLIADRNKDYRIHDMIEYLRQVDRHVKRNKVAT